MKIDGATFGSITIDGKSYDHDVIVRLSDKVEKRKKKLSKRVYGSSHTVSEDEAKFIFEKGCKQLIFGTGQDGMASLSPEASPGRGRTGPGHRDTAGNLPNDLHVPYVRLGGGIARPDGETKIEQRRKYPPADEKTLLPARELLKLGTLRYLPESNSAMPNPPSFRKTNRCR